MPFGQAGVEPGLIVSEAVLAFWEWVLVGMVGRSGRGWVRVWAWPPHPIPLPHRLFFQEDLGAVGQKGDRVRIGTLRWESSAWLHGLMSTGSGVLLAGGPLGHLGV